MLNNLKKIRLKNKISQEELARIIDCSTRTIQNIENKVYSPSVYLAIKIKKALDIDNIEDIFPC